MRSRYTVLAISTVALATFSGCAAGVRYDNRYAYDNRPGYNEGYGDEGYGYEASAELTPIAAPPELVVLPGTDIYAAPNLNVDLYFADGYWWRPWNGHWYRSHYYDRDWGLVSSAPYFYGTIPHGWRDDYHHGQWRGRPYNYYHVGRSEVTTNWDKWKREGYWRDNRWASSRDRYRRDRVSETQRYDDRRTNDSRDDRRDNYKQGDRDRYDRSGTYTSGDRDRNEARTPDRYDRSGTYTTDDRDRREPTTDRYDDSHRQQYTPRETSTPVYRSEGTRTAPRHVQPSTQRREVRPTTRTRTETHTVPAVRSTRPAPPTSTMRRTTEQPTRRTMEQPVRRSTTVRTEQRTTTTPAARPSDRGHRAAPPQSQRPDQRQDDRRNDEHR